MKARELRNMSIKDLRKKEDELRRQLLKLRIRRKIEGLPNPMEIRKVKKDLARVLTIIREKTARGEE